MTIVSLDPATGTSCSAGADRGSGPGRLVELRLLGDERSDLCRPPADRRRGRLRVRRARLRDGVPHRPHAGLAEPVLDDPARQAPSGGALGTLVGGGVVWTPTTVDPTTNTLYFGTGCRDAALLPVAPARLRPAHRLADRRRPRDRADEVVAAADVVQRVVVRHLAAADGLHREGRRQDASGSSRSRRWKASGSRTTPRPGADLPADQGDRQRRASGAAAGEARRGLPVFARRRSTTRPLPSTRRRTTSSTRPPRRRRARDSRRPTPTQKKRKFTLGDVFLGLGNGDFGYLLPGWHDYGSISAIDVEHRARVWKFDTPEPERGGVTTTDGLRARLRRRRRRHAAGVRR